jgi:cysteine desulfurase
MSAVYLDNAATTPLCAEARAAMEPYLAERFGNASEPHGFGRAARAGHARRQTTAPLLISHTRSCGTNPRI